MKQTEVERLAAAVHQLRPDWRQNSLATFIGRNLGERAHLDVALAMVWVALDPDTETPARVLGSGPWWKVARPQQEATRVPPSLRSEAICQGCNRDRSGHDAVNALDPSSAHEWLTLAEVEARSVRRLA